MIKKIYSKKDKSVILSIIFFGSKVYPEKSLKSHFITDNDYPLQTMMHEFPKGKEIKPHKHNPQYRETLSTNEAILVFDGSIEMSVFDVDQNIVKKIILKRGDCSIIINGGHGIKVLEDSKIFEFKNGPFYGSDKDRTYF